MKVSGINPFALQTQGLGQKTLSKDKNAFGNALAEDVRIVHNVKSIFSLSISKVDETQHMGKTDEKLHEDIVAEMEEFNKVATEHIRYLNDNLFKLFGIRGEIKGTSIQRLPQRFGTYYVETPGANNKNILLVELENGEFLIKETSLERDEVDTLLDRFRDEYDFGMGKINVDRLRDLFELFLSRI